ncbi:hypothetical protein, partial [Aquitalea pelogenes]|uniref:hypothetical protein n=1 Tax=Aquitalea pelogenes TaxID=1293573 RepID=UPI00137B91DA
WMIYAAGHAEREMSSLLAKAPRHANRLEGGHSNACRWMIYAAGHAEREMSSLLAKAPRHANRLEGGHS